MKGSTYKRCGCTDSAGKPLGADCPKLGGRSHGTWYFYAELTTGPGGRRRQRQGGFASQRDAQAALVDRLDRVQAAEAAVRLVPRRTPAVHPGPFRPHPATSGHRRRGHR